jgi:hypothetical protein
MLGFSRKRRRAPSPLVGEGWRVDLLQSRIGNFNPHP